MALYAAYGSNLDPRADGRAHPHSPPQGSGWLDGWRLTFGGEDLGWEGALATVVEEPGAQVFVMLYDLSAAGRGGARPVGGLATSGCTARSGSGCTTLDGDVAAWLYVLDAYEGGLPGRALPRASSPTPPRWPARPTTTSRSLATPTVPILRVVASPA